MEIEVLGEGDDRVIVTLDVETRGGDALPTSKTKGKWAVFVARFPSGGTKFLFQLRGLDADEARSVFDEQRAAFVNGAPSGR